VITDRELCLNACGVLHSLAACPDATWRTVSMTDGEQTCYWLHSVHCILLLQLNTLTLALLYTDNTTRRQTDASSAQRNTISARCLQQNRGRSDWEYLDREVLTVHNHKGVGWHSMDAIIISTCSVKSKHIPNKVKLHGSMLSRVYREHVLCTGCDFLGACTILCVHVLSTLCLTVSSVRARSPQKENRSQQHTIWKCCTRREC
jgi:hypothetical protein